MKKQMKLLTIPLAFALGILCVIVLLALRTDDQDGKTVLELEWDGPYALQVPSSEITVDSLGHKSLTIRPPFTELAGYRHVDFQADLFRIPNPPVHSRFALEGTISYTNMPCKSALLMRGYFLTKTTEFETDDDEGPAESLRGTSESRRFILPYAGLPKEGKPLQLDLSLLLEGTPFNDSTSNGQPASLTLSNLKLVSFPDPTATGRVLHWKSFWIGVTTTAVVSLAAAQVILLMRSLKKLRADREMRRIASMDT